MGLTRKTVEEMHALSGADLAKLLGYSRSAPSSWGSRGCPRNADGSYNLQEVVRWLQGQSKGADDLSELDAATLRYRLAKAKLAELQLATARGKLIPIKDADAVFGKLVAMTNQALRNVARGCADRLIYLESPTDAETIVSKEIEDALSILAEGPEDPRFRRSTPRRGDGNTHRPDDRGPPDRGARAMPEGTCGGAGESNTG